MSIEEDARIALAAIQAQQAHELALIEKTQMVTETLNDMTIADQTGESSAPKKKVTVKKKGKPKLTAKERKERNVRVSSCLQVTHKSFIILFVLCRWRLRRP